MIFNGKRRKREITQTNPNEKAAGVRAPKTVVQTAPVCRRSRAYHGGGSRRLAASTAALSGFLSVLTSAAGMPELKGAAPSDGAPLAGRKAKTNKL